MKRRPTRAALDHPTMRRLLGGDLLGRLGDADPARAPLVIGSQVWSTHRLATELGVVNTRAARLLSAAAAAIGAKDVRDLYKRATPYTLAGVDGLGETTLPPLARNGQAERIVGQVLAKLAKQRELKMTADGAVATARLVAPAVNGASPA